MIDDIRYYLYEHEGLLMLGIMLIADIRSDLLIKPDTTNSLVIRLIPPCLQLKSYIRLRSYVFVAYLIVVAIAIAADDDKLR